MKEISWDQIIEEAEKLEPQFLGVDIDLSKPKKAGGFFSEAEKAGDFFIKHQYDDNEMKKYLKILATNPPERSKKTASYYRNMRDIWLDWETDLSGQNKARAWGWGIRLAKSQVVLRIDI